MLSIMNERITMVNLITVCLFTGEGLLPPHPQQLNVEQKPFLLACQTFGEDGKFSYSIEEKKIVMSGGGDEGVRFIIKQKLRKPIKKKFLILSLIKRLLKA